MTREKICGIYKITSPTGCIYIGQSRDIEKMRKARLGKSNGPLSFETKEKIAKANRGKTVSIETRKKQSKARKGKPVSEKEKQRLRNLRKGIPNSEEAKKKISEKLKGRKFSPETIEKMRQNGLKRKTTEETKEKLRQANLGKKYSEETKRKQSEAHKGKFTGSKNPMAVSVCQISLDGFLLAVYDTQKEASKETGIPNTNISSCVRNKSKKAGGYLWK